MTISPDARWRRRLVVMVKEPHPGRVKTRLGAEIGMVAAARWFRHQSASLLRRLDDPRWQLVLAVSPDRAGMRSRVWPRHLGRIPQGPGDLGDRMTRLFRSLPPGPTLIIGADVPGITRNHIATAFAALGRNDVVLGPATDGGYWLIGMARHGALPPDLLDNVRWSSKYALSDTRAALEPRRIAMIDRLADIDTAADLNGGSP